MQKHKVKKKLKKKAQGLKFDDNKPKVHLVLPKFILGMARILTFGAVKYGEHNWKKGIAYSRLISSAQRHLLAFSDGIDKDEESGESHLLHCAVNLMFLYFFSIFRKDLDDR